MALSPGQVGGKRAEQVERKTLTQAELTTGCSTLSSTDSKTALLSEHPGGRMSWEWPMGPGGNVGAPDPTCKPHSFTQAFEF